MKNNEKTIRKIVDDLIFWKDIYEIQILGIKDYEGNDKIYGILLKDVDEEDVKRIEEMVRKITRKKRESS